MSDGLVITMKHVRAARLDGAGIACAPGARLWARRHGIDVRDFLKNGMPIDRAEQLAEVDAFAARIVALAKADAEGAHADL